MSDISDLTPKQKAVYDCLPETRKNIAEHLDISRRSVRYRMSAIEEDTDIDFERDSDGVWYVSDGSFDGEDDSPSVDEESLEEAYRDANEQTRSDEEESEIVSYNRDSMDTESKREAWRVNSYNKAQATKDVNNELTEIEQELKEALNSRTIQYTDFDRSENASTLVIPRSDDHFGVKVDGRSINEEYSTPIARERVNYVIDHAIQKSRERGDVEDVVVPLLGDFVDGEKVYPGHESNLGQYLRGQIREAAKVYINQVEKLADEFDHVTVVTCPGNHGSFGDGVVSNADDIVYDEVELGIDLLGIDNVSFQHSPNSVYVEFDIRGWKAYGRHGQDALEHASTSSGDDRWMNWKEESDFDVAYHGHHHQLRTEPVGYAQLFQCGTTVPPSLFVNQIGKTGVPRVFYHFTTDEQMIDGMEIINF